MYSNRTAIIFYSSGFFTDEKAYLVPAPEETAESPIEVKEEVEERSTVPRPLPQSVKIRPWDLGKEGVPKKQGIKLDSNSYNFIHINKIPGITHFEPLEVRLNLKESNEVL